jgi:hypothetical protein
MCGDVNRAMGRKPAMLGVNVAGGRRGQGEREKGRRGEEEKRRRGEEEKRRRGEEETGGWRGFSGVPSPQPSPGGRGGRNVSAHVICRREGKGVGMYPVSLSVVRRGRGLAGLFFGFCDFWRTF